MACRWRHGPEDRQNISQNIILKRNLVAVNDALQVRVGGGRYEFADAAGLPLR